MTIKLDGKRVAAEVKANLAERVSTLKEHGIVPVWERCWSGRIPVR